MNKFIEFFFSKYESDIEKEKILKLACYLFSLEFLLIHYSSNNDIEKIYQLSPNEIIEKAEQQLEIQKDSLNNESLILNTKKYLSLLNDSKKVKELKVFKEEKKIIYS